ncbi:MAG: lysophospholipid acyltransferase family protein [Phenylobacterium sp.]|uniref:lysophospholipid acyltransferase family protein n=1 Tax=Phenylobacterium sp. TaxID=1871053 RepID=UPI002732B2E8|nr:lysophospholipid acyltransferase family protein [Phenylobacterium sp.]MDP3745562.1 lysophospholipid acyltransferase family protein [Phenylobacterium sp.]
MIALRSFVFVALFYLWSVFVAVGLSPVLFGPRRWTMALIGMWGKGIVWLLEVCCDVRVDVRGKEHMPKGAALVASKHQCMFDVFAQFAWLPDACFVTKKELMWIPFFSWWARRAQMIVVNREGHATALRKLMRDSKERFVDDRQLLIFPEGTRMAPGAPPDYKPGVAALYRELDVPVHPVATNSGVHWPKHGFIRRPGTIVFEYLEPIMPGLKRAEFMRLLQDRIETASNGLLDL